MDKNKRKRTANTSTKQYEIYLDEMEKDYKFRSGTGSPEYIEKKWDILAKRLNVEGKGPALSKIIWKKRFKDWKNATRAKYRRLSRQMDRFGSDEIGLNPLEERGLGVWGSVGVTGTHMFEVRDSPTDTDTKPINEIEIVQADDNIMEEEELKIEPVNTQNSNNDHQYVRSNSVFPLQGRSRRRRMGTATARKMSSPTEVTDVPTALKNIGDSLRIAINKFTNVYEKVNEQKFDLENRKLEFEMKKYQFENPDFNMS